jgi:hypothetical protein
VIWLGAHSDASLKWLFGPEFITAQLSINAQMPFMKRVKEMFRLRRLLVEKLIATQQQYICPNINNTNRVLPNSLTQPRLIGNNYRRNLPRSGARTHQNLVSNPGQGLRASSVTWINTTLHGPPTQLGTPQRRKRKRYRHTPITKFYAPCDQPCPTLPLRHPNNPKPAI